MNPVQAEVQISQKAQDFGDLIPSERRIAAIFAKNTEVDWQNWRWHLRHRIKAKGDLKKIIRLTPEEEAGIDQLGNKLSMAITPYFASMMHPQDPQCPIRRQCVPTVHELQTHSEELVDPCGEDKYSPVHGLVHRYPDRVLFLVTEMCAMYCRYCTRSRMVGDGKRSLSTATYDAAFDYIRKNKKIRDVLISGGDPLILPNHLLAYLIRKIREIPHVEFIRIGTRMPVSLPQRVTPELAQILKEHGPIWMSLHFTHHKEVTARVREACALLADNGIPLGSQTVLLRGINDKPRTMKKLMHELLKIRVRPYYIYQCDPVVGSRHFRTPINAGLKIIESLRGHTSGYAVPTYVVDAPGGGGKIPISPNYVVSSHGGKYTLRNYDAEHYIHLDP